MSRAGEGEALSRGIPRSLRLWWGSAALPSLLAAAAVAALMPLTVRERLLYLGASGAALFAVFGLLWMLLGEIRVEGAERASPVPGVANSVTVARAALTALLAGLLVVPRLPGRAAWLAALLYLGVALGDALDGWLARRRRFVTRLGTRLDLEVDAASLLVATLLGVRYGTLPVWVVAAGAARYVYVGVRAVAGRLVRGGEERPLPPSRTRRLRAGQQMGLVAVALWPPAPPDGVELAAVVVTLPFLAGFLRDALVVTGALDPSSPLYRRARSASLFVAEVAMPAVARLALGIGFGLAIVCLSGAAGGPAALERWTATLAGWGWPAAGVWARLGAVAGLAAAAATLGGILPRSASLVLAAVFFVELQSVALDPLRALLLVAVLWVLVFGPGPWALWARDEALLGRD